MKVIALVDLPNRRAAGELFEVPDDQGRVLILLGRACAAADAAVGEEIHVHPIQEAADDPTAHVSAAGRRRPTYRRRDLTAESSED